MRGNSLTWLVALLLLALPGQAATQDAPCRTVAHEGRGYTVCEVTADQDLRLFLTAPDGRPFASFQRIEQDLAGQGKGLVFAMNAGMYHSDRSPVGLYIESGLEAAPLITSKGPGNFGMLPNGVFCIRPGRLAVIESRAFAKARPRCTHATQSGPMLLIDGKPHPRFIPGSASRYIRNGVGVSDDGRRAYLAISSERVNFDEFARFFRDALAVRDALYFDGKISRLHAPGIGRADFGFAMGPVIGLVASR